LNAFIIIIENNLGVDGFLATLYFFIDYTSFVCLLSQVLSNIAYGICC